MSINLAVTSGIKLLSFFPCPKCQQKEITFYYPAPHVAPRRLDQTMILSFDSLGILLSEHLKGKPEREDPAIAIPLRELGLLHQPGSYW